MLRFDKLTVKAREAVQAALEIAAERGHQQIEPLHLLAVLAGQQEGLVRPLLAKLGVREEALGSELESALAKLP